MPRSWIDPSVGSAGDSYDNALAESVIGLYKAEVIYRLCPWRNAEHVEFEELYYQHQEAPAMAAGLN